MSANMQSREWRPDSWRRKSAAQQPVYPDPTALEAALLQLRQLPPLVSSWEVESLKQQLAEAALGRRFLLQGGDCSESFADCESGVIVSKLKILLQMSLVLVQGARQRVIRVGRFGGQYAKPRSSDTETREGVTLPGYRGDLVNRVAFQPEQRRPARPAFASARLRARRVDDQFYPGAGGWWICGSASPGVLGAAVWAQIAVGR